jgi:hypothetical protein
MLWVIGDIHGYIASYEKILWTHPTSRLGMRLMGKEGQLMAVSESHHAKDARCLV